MADPAPDLTARPVAGATAGWTAPPGLRALLAFADDRHALVASVRAGVVVFIALAGTAALGRLDLSAYAAFGSFSTLYGRGLHAGDRLRMQCEAGVALVACTIIGGITALSPDREWLEVPATAVVAGLLLALSRHRGWIPPGALFMAFAVSAVAAHAPAGPAELPAGAAVALAALATALLVNMAFDLGTAVRVRLTRRPAPATAPRPAPVALGRDDIEKSVVLALATAAAGCFAVVAGFGHPYWAMVTVVAALSAPDAGRKVVRSLHRGLGSVIGTLLAVFLYRLETGLRLPVLAAIGVAALLQVGAELLVTRNYGAAVVFVTPLAVTMTWLAAGPDASAVTDRLTETAVGLAAAALVIVPLALRAARASHDRRRNLP